MNPKTENHYVARASKVFIQENTKGTGYIVGSALHEDMRREAFDQVVLCGFAYFMNRIFSIVAIMHERCI